jgi:hypothetical protein
MRLDEEEYVWTWPRYNPPGLLIGPLPYRRTPSGGWAPDYRHPGVAERIRVEVSFIVDQDRRT